MLRPPAGFNNCLLYPSSRFSGVFFPPITQCGGRLKCPAASAVKEGRIELTLRTSFGGVSPLNLALQEPPQKTSPALIQYKIIKA